MVVKLRRLVVPVFLMLALLIPLGSLSTSAYATPATSITSTVVVANPAYPDDSPSTNQQGTPSNQGNHQSPQQGTQSNQPGVQLDTTDRDHDPAIKTDPDKDYGNFLKGGVLDQEGLNTGYQSAQTWVKMVSLAVGWIIALVFILVLLTNALGLFYVAVPIGFIRNILSGGLYGNATGMHAPGQQMGGMMSGMGMNRMGGMGMSGMSQPPAGSAAQGGVLRHLRFVPSAAIQAVELAESGGTGGASGMRPGMMQSGGAYGAGMGMPAQQVGGSAQMVSPIRYFLMKQIWEMVALGFAVVVLILSSVLPDSGIALGNGFVQVIYWALSYIV